MRWPGRAGGPAAIPAVIAVAEDGTEQLLSLAELRRRVGRRAGRAAPARVSEPGDRVVALVPNSVRGAGRVPGHRGAGRGVVVLLAGLRCALGDRPVHPDLPDGAARRRRIPLRRPEFAVAETVRKIRQALPSLAGAVHIPPSAPPPRTA